MGIAIPHAQTAAVSRPSVAFARSPDGVDFGSPDGTSATLLFLILVPESGAETHLTVLSSLSRALVDESVRNRLHAVESVDAVRGVLRDALTVE